MIYVPRREEECVVATKILFLLFTITVSRCPSTMGDAAVRENDHTDVDLDDR